jgi:hypothetical protein
MHYVTRHCPTCLPHIHARIARRSRRFDRRARPSAVRTHSGKDINFRTTRRFGVDLVNFFILRERRGVKLWRSFTVTGAYPETNLIFFFRPWCASCQKRKEKSNVVSRFAYFHRALCALGLPPAPVGTVPRHPCPFRSTFFFGQFGPLKAV